MLAECNWHLGDIAKAREQVDIVFQIARRYKGWLFRPIWEELMAQGAVVAPEPGLWPEATAIKRLPLSNRMQFRAGVRLTEEVIARGGVIEEANIKVIDVIEVMRGLQIAAHRRRIIMGPLSKEDTLPTEMLSGINYPAGLQIPLAKALIGAVRATGYFSAFRDEDCESNAVKYAMSGGSAHPLSPLALLCALQH